MTQSTAHSQRRLLASNSLDAAGRTLADLILDLVLVLVLGASAFELGLLNALGSVAFAVAAVPIGYLVDRFGALRLMRVGLGGKLVLLVVLAVLLATGQLTVPTALVLVTLLGLGHLIVETSQISAVPGLNDEPDNGRGIAKLVSRLTAADQALNIVIPAIGGVAFRLAGASILMSLAAALALVALASAVRIKPMQTPPVQASATAEADDATRGHVSADNTPAGTWLSGFAVLFNDRRLLAVTVLVSLCNAGLAVGAAVEGILILRHLELGAVWFGAITAVGALGGILGASFGPGVSARFALSRLTAATGVAQVGLSALVLLAYFAPPGLTLVLLLVQAFFWGLVLVIFNIANMSWVTTLVHPALLGRLTSVRRLFTFGSVPLGSLVGGLLGSSAGIWATLLLWCVLCVLANVCYFLLKPR